MGMICFMVSISFLLTAVVASIYTTGEIIKNSKAEKKQRKLDNANGIKRFPYLAHVEGLEAAEKSPCSVILNASSLMISCAGKEYTLPLKRITYVDYIVDIDKIRYLENSTAKGIMGAALFGVSGAVIGTAPKTKVAHEEIGYAVIEYRDAREREKRIILRDQTVNSYRCGWMVNELKSCIHTTVEKVEL